jgi:DNA primase
VNPARFDIPAIRERNDLATVVGQVVALKRSGHRHKGNCPFHAEKTPSFYVIDQCAAAHFHCFGCGAHGDVIGFVMRIQALSFVEACRMLSAQGGLDDPKVLDQARRRALQQAEAAAARDAANRERQRRLSAKIWTETERITDQAPALGYFDRRGIDIGRLPDARLPADIRFHPALEYWWASENGTRESIAKTPALVSAIRAPDGHGVGVEIKYIAADGAKAEIVDPETGEILTHKKMRGNPWGGAIHLAPAAKTMAFGEGMETCLSIMMAEPNLPVWACLSIGNLAGAALGRGRRIATPGNPDRAFRYLPSATPDLEKPAFLPPASCRTAILLEDADNADPDAAANQYACAAARWKAAGHTVSRIRPPAGMDFNDLVKRKAAA